MFLENLQRKGPFGPFRQGGGVCFQGSQQVSKAYYVWNYRLDGYHLKDACSSRPLKVLQAGAHGIAATNSIWQGSSLAHQSQKPTGQWPVACRSTGGYAAIVDADVQSVVGTISCSKLVQNRQGQRPILQPEGVQKLFAVALPELRDLQIQQLKIVHSFAFNFASLCRFQKCCNVFCFGQAASQHRTWAACEGLKQRHSTQAFPGSSVQSSPSPWNMRTAKLCLIIPQHKVTILWWPSAHPLQLGTWLLCQFSGTLSQRTDNGLPRSMLSIFRSFCAQAPGKRLLFHPRTGTTFCVPSL